MKTIFHAPISGRSLMSSACITCPTATADLSSACFVAASARQPFEVLDTSAQIDLAANLGKKSGFIAIFGGKKIIDKTVLGARTHDGGKHPVESVFAQSKRRRSHRDIKAPLGFYANMAHAAHRPAVHAS